MLSKWRCCIKFNAFTAFNIESKVMKFFDLDKLPPDDEQHDGDLIEQYKKYLNNK